MYHAVCTIVEKVVTFGEQNYIKINVVNIIGDHNQRQLKVRSTKKRRNIFVPTMITTMDVQDCLQNMFFLLCCVYPDVDVCILYTDIH